MSDFNPYRAPSAEFLGKQLVDFGMWRDGELLVMCKGCDFPDRCVKCNDDAEGYRLNRNFYWQPRWYYLILLTFPFFVILSLILFAVVSLIFRKQAKLLLPLCPRHRRARIRDIFIGWSGFLVGIGLIVFCAGFGELWGAGMQALGITCGVLLLLVSTLYGMFRSRILVASKMTEAMVWLREVSPLFLATLADVDVRAPDAWLSHPTGMTAQESKLDHLNVVEDFREL